MNPIPLHLLEAMLVIAEGESLERAAQRLGLTQPAISKRLRSLERYFPEPLFSQMGRRKVLTPFGSSIAQRIQARMGDIQLVLEQEVARASSLENARVRISARRGVLQRALNVKFAGSILFREASHEEILESVRNLKTDIGITHAAPASLELIARPLFREKFKVVIPKSFMRTRPATQRLSSLANIPCLSYHERDSLLNAFANHHGVGALRSRRVIEDYDALRSMAESQAGWSILPAYLEAKNCWELEIEREVLPKREFYLIYRPEFKNVSWFKVLVRELQNCF